MEGRMEHINGDVTYDIQNLGLIKLPEYDGGKISACIAYSDAMARDRGINLVQFVTENTGEKLLMLGGPIYKIKNKELRIFAIQYLAIYESQLKAVEAVWGRDDTLIALDVFVARSCGYSAETYKKLKELYVLELKHNRYLHETKKESEIFENANKIITDKAYKILKEPMN